MYNTPLRFTEQIFISLRKKGYKNEVSFNILKAEIKRLTGIVKDNTASQLIKTFRELGYIGESEMGVFKILYWKDEKEIKKEAEAIAKEEVEKYEKMKEGKE